MQIKLIMQIFTVQLNVAIYVFDDMEIELRKSNASAIINYYYYF